MGSAKIGGAGIMTKPTSTWEEKLRKPTNLPIVEPMPPRMVRLFGEGTICVPSPLEVDGIMRTVPRGRLMSVNQLREIIAKKHGATVGCPMGCGLFINMAARAAEEAEAAGQTDFTPWWRIVKEGGKLNEKYPGGVVAQWERLEAEGFVIEEGRGKQPPRVKYYERYLVEIL